MPTVSIYGSSGQLTELPTVSIYGSSGQPNLHGKISMGSPRAAHSVAHGQRSGQLPVFFSVWDTPTEMSKVQSDKMFDCTAVADRLRTVSWSNYGHPTGVATRIIYRRTDGRKDRRTTGYRIRSIGLDQ